MRRLKITSMLNQIVMSTAIKRNVDLVFLVRLDFELKESYLFHLYFNKFILRKT